MYIQKILTITGAGNFRVNPRFHPMSVGWNLGLTREFPTPVSYASDVSRKNLVIQYGGRESMCTTPGGGIDIT